MTPDPTAPFTTAPSSSSPEPIYPDPTSSPADDDQKEHLAAALYHLDQARLQALHRADRDQSLRLQAIWERADEERQLLPDRTLRLYPREEPGQRRTLGWMLRHDPHVRSLRLTRGLPLPEMPLQ